MSLDFKLHYDRLREGDPTKPEIAVATEETGTFFDSPSHTRNLCLIWPDGKQQYFNYAYLTSGEFLPNNEVNIITLNFSSCIVKLKGYNLKQLFSALIDCLPRTIVVLDVRYSQTATEEKGIVIESTTQPIK